MVVDVMVWISFLILFAHSFKLCIVPYIQAMHGSGYFDWRQKKYNNVNRNLIDIQNEAVTHTVVFVVMQFEKKEFHWVALVFGGQ